MKLNGVFKKPKNELESQGWIPGAIETIGEKANKILKVEKTEQSDRQERADRARKTGMKENGEASGAAEGKKPESMFLCPECKETVPLKLLRKNQNVCKCGYHARTGGRTRLDFLVDRGSFKELFVDLESRDILGFEGYEEKLLAAQKKSGEKDAVICGTAKINGKLCALFIMDSHFMMGSMGTVVGEKITRLFEYATERRLSVVGYTVSGGARMQEGILSLMQMAKTSGAVKRHSEAGLFYLTVLTDPTTGGVTASFAMEGDIIMAEPGATVGFAGARVIEQTIRKKLPEEFQRAEFLLEHGFIDLIVPRKQQRAVISQLLAIHSGQMVFASDRVDQQETQHRYQLKQEGLAVSHPDSGENIFSEGNWEKDQESSEPQTLIRWDSKDGEDKGDLAYE